MLRADSLNGGEVSWRLDASLSVHSLWVLHLNISLNRIVWLATALIKAQGVHLIMMLARALLDARDGVLCFCTSHTTFDFI